MKKGGTILPRTVKQIACETIYDYYTYILDNFILPTWLYPFAKVYVTFATCLLFTNFHQAGTGIKPLEVFLNLYATALDDQWATINFIINLILNVIIYSSIIGCSIVYTTRSHMRKWSTTFNVICIEFLMPFILLTSGSQIGNNVGLLYDDIRNSIIWLYTIIQLFWVVVTFIFNSLFLASYIPFVPGRSSALTPAFQSFELNIIIVIRILARSANATIGTIVAKICRVLIAILLAIGIFIIIFYNINHSRTYSAFISAVFCAGFVLDVLGIFISLDWVIRLLIFFGIIAIGTFVINIILKRQQKKVSEIFTAMENEELTFEDVFPKINGQYLRYCMEAFKMGHPYLLTFKPLVEGAHNENTNSKVWMFYLRVLAIYNSRIYDLMNACSEFKRLGFADIQSILFVRGIEHIIEYRSPKVTKQCKSILKNIQTQTRMLKGTVVKYWEAIESDYPGGAYAYGASAQKQMDQIEKVYDSALTKWPNASLIYKSYSRFINHICNNRMKGEQYAALGSLTRKIDLIEIRAKKLFPLLPMVLPDPENAMREDAHNKNDGASVLSASLAGSSSNSLNDNEELEAELAQQNTLYEMGKRASIPINYCITAFVIISFILLFELGVVMTNVIILQKYQVFKTLLEFLSSFTSMLFYSSRTVYYMASFVADKLSLSYNTTTVTKLLGAESELATLNSTSNLIISDIMELNTNIANFLSLKPTVKDYIGNVTELVTNIQIKYNMIYLNTSNIFNNNKPYIPLLAAMNVQASYISSFSQKFVENAASYQREKWFMYMLENNYRVNDALDLISKYVASNMLDFATEINQFAMIMCIVFSCISVLVFPITLIMLRIQAKKYDYIINSMHKIPSLVIIQHISELTNNSLEDKNNRAEVALQIQNSHGIQTVLVSILSGFCIIIFAAIYVVNYLVLTQSTDSFRVLPYQMMNSALLANHIYNEMATMKRVFGVNQNLSFNADTSYLGKTIWPKTTRKIEDSIDQMLFGISSQTNVSYGYLLTKSNSRNLFFSGENSTGTSLHDFMIKFGYVFSIEVDASEIRFFDDKATNKNIFNRDNERLNNMLHYNDIHLSTGILDKIISNTFVDMNDVIQKQVALAIVTPIVGFLILATFIGIFVYYQGKVLRTFRFTIMSLSMLDQKFIQSNERLLDIVAGDFNSDKQSESIPSHYIQCLKEHTNDPVILTTKNFDIIEMNNAAKNISKNAVHAKNVEDLFGNIPNEFRKVVESNEPCMESVERIMKDDDGKEYIAAVSITQTNNNDIFIIIHRDIVAEQLKEEREKTESKLKNIIYRLVPHDFREIFGDNLFRTVQFENLLVLAIRAKNITFNEDDDDDKLKVTLNKMSIFNKSIINASKSSDDCAIAKKHNMTNFVIFNFKSQKRSMTQPMEQALEIIKQVNSECSSNGISISASVAYAKMCFIGIPSINKANFNVFFPELGMMLHSLDNSNEDELHCFYLDRDIPQRLREKVRKSDECSLLMIKDCV